MQNVAQGIDDDISLYKIVDQLLEQEDQIKTRIGTSKTAYRRVHERLASSIDKILEKLRNYKYEEGKNIDIKDIAGSALADLARSKILLNYQNARGQISDDLKSILESIVDKLAKDIESIQSSDSQKLEELRKKLERARTLIDVIAVLVYKKEKARES